MSDATDVGAGASAAAWSQAERDAEAARRIGAGTLPADGWIDEFGNPRDADGSLYVFINRARVQGEDAVAGNVAPQTSFLPGLLGLLKFPDIVPKWLWYALALGAVLILTRGHGARAASRARSRY